MHAIHQKLPTPVIETERLYLKAILPGTMNQLFDQMDDEEIKQFLGLTDAQLQTEGDKYNGNLEDSVCFRLLKREFTT